MCGHVGAHDELSEQHSEGGDGMRGSGDEEAGSSSGSGSEDGGEESEADEEGSGDDVVSWFSCFLMCSPCLRLLQAWPMR